MRVNQLQTTCPPPAREDFGLVPRLRDEGGPVRRSFSGGGSTLQLLSHFLKLLTDYRSVEAIDGDACHADLPASP